jgi:AcrR family transcriptional regulator
MVNNDDLNPSNSSQKILEAAINEFTEYGFEGARVARIAKKAGVSQALLYYNFGSKQAIMDEILNNFFKSNIELFNISVPAGQDITQSNAAFTTELHKSLEFILENHKEVKILLMQALLGSQSDKRLLTMFGDLNQVTRKRVLNDLGYTFRENYQGNQEIIDYFLVFIPFIMFGLLGEEWSQVNNIPLAKVKDTLTEAVIFIYKNYLK